MQAGQRHAHLAVAPAHPAPGTPLHFKQVKLSVPGIGLKGRNFKLPQVPASLAGQFQAIRSIQVQHLQGVGPGHAKSSAEGIRVKLILPPTLPPSGGLHGPMLVTVRPKRRFAPSIASPTLSHR